jgi:hypothetical protein
VRWKATLAVLMGVGENEAMADYYEHRNAYFLVASVSAC